MQPTLGLMEAAMQMANRFGQGLLHHSDRDSQYAIHVNQQQLEWKKIRCSMIRKGDCSR